MAQKREAKTKGAKHASVTPNHENPDQVRLKAAGSVTKVTPGLCLEPYVGKLRRRLRSTSSCVIWIDHSSTAFSLTAMASGCVFTLHTVENAGQLKFLRNLSQHQAGKLQKVWWPGVEHFSGLIFFGRRRKSQRPLLRVGFRCYLKRSRGEVAGQQCQREPTKAG